MRGDLSLHTDPAGEVRAPTGIIAGPDGDIWFTSIGNHRVGRVRVATGEVETFADPTDAVRLPANIIPAADGRLWFTSLGSAMLASIDPAAPDPAASIEHHPDPRLDHPVAIKSAPDGCLWFTLRGGDGGVGSIDPRHARPLTTLAVHTAPSIADPSALFVDPDGAVWWVNAATGSIGHHDPRTGRIDAIAPEVLGATPRAWACDAEGRLWVTTRDPAGLLSLDPRADDVADTVARVTHPGLRTPDGVWFGPDGALWVADTDADRIVRFDPSAPAEHRWASFGQPPFVDGPFDIKSGGAGDRRVWFTNKTGDSIGAIDSGP